jgi:hypothetical protein
VFTKWDILAVSIHMQPSQWQRTTMRTANLERGREGEREEESVYEQVREGNTRLSVLRVDH